MDNDIALLKIQRRNGRGFRYTVADVRVLTRSAHPPPLLYPPLLSYVEHIRTWAFYFLFFNLIDLSKNMAHYMILIFHYLFLINQ